MRQRWKKIVGHTAIAVATLLVFALCFSPAVFAQEGGQTPPPHPYGHAPQSHYPQPTGPWQGCAPAVPETGAHNEQNPTGILGTSVPLTGADGGCWALFNLISGILGLLAAVFVLLHWLIRQYPALLFTRLCCILATVAAGCSLAVFFAVQNLSLPVVWLNQWSILHTIFLVTQAILFILMAKAQKIATVPQPIQQEEEQILNTNSNIY